MKENVEPHSDPCHWSGTTPVNLPKLDPPGTHFPPNMPLEPLNHYPKPFTWSLKNRIYSCEHLHYSCETFISMYPTPHSYFIQPHVYNHCHWCPYVNAERFTFQSAISIFFSCILIPLTSLPIIYFYFNVWGPRLEAIRVTSLLHCLHIFCWSSPGILVTDGEELANVNIISAKLGCKGQIYTQIHGATCTVSYIWHLHIEYSN